MGTSVLDTPETLIETGITTTHDLPWQVVLYNDETHSFQEVILQLQKAIGMSPEAAFEIAMTVHTRGNAICYQGTRSACDKVADVLREIGLHVEVIPVDG